MVQQKCAVVLIFLSSLLVTAFSRDLAYRNRGDRFEGRKNQAIGREDLQLWGAMVRPGAASWSPDGRAEISFFLPDPGSPAITVRERARRFDYWLDRAVLAQRPAVINSFSWSRADVIEPLKLLPRDLLVVARLAQAGSFERVAPVFLGGKPTGRIEHYRLTFVAQDRVLLHPYLERPGRAAELLAPEFKGSERLPFDLDLDASSWPLGTYRLRLEGRFERSGRPVKQVVDFLHVPIWPR